MQYDLRAFSERTEEILTWLRGEYAGIQSGNITAATVRDVMVTAYGSKTSVPHCASVTLENTRTLLVTPYDASLLGAIETALREQVSFATLSVTDTGIRVIAQAPTGDTRLALEKAVGERAEIARQSVRSTCLLYTSPSPRD